jgi:uncharacterized protein YndB with AHSA1/START domain
MKKKIELEYYIKTTPRVIFPRLSTPGGLSEWFADNVTIKGQHEYSFHWDNTIQKAEQTYVRENQAVKYEWLGEDEPNYFEFRLKTDELTGELALIVTDFAEDDEKDGTIELWDTQIAKLKHTLGI